MIFNLIKTAKQLFINKKNTGVEADNVEDAIKVLKSDLDTREVLSEGLPTNLLLSKYQKTVTMMTNTSNISVAELIAYNIPYGYKPYSTIRIPCWYLDDVGYHKGMIVIYYHGQIQIFRLSSDSTSATTVTTGKVVANASWIIG